jgi:alpha-tubulin suppressor-like RCC1 family protein
MRRSGRRRRWRGGSALIGWAAAVAGACAAPPPFVCHDNEACVSGETRGVCEANGSCSFPDAACPSHQRYASEGGGDAAGRCVPVTGDCIVEIVGGGTTEDQLDVGHTCVRKTDGTVWCWGDNSFGQLGAGAEVGARSAVPVPVALPAGQIAAKVSSGEIFACAMIDGGAAYCWGDNSEGQLGVGIGGANPTGSDTPMRVAPAPVARTIGAGGAHACLIGVGTDAAVYCWGENTDGQVAIGAADPQPVPFLVAGLVGSVDVASADQHSCSIGDNSSVWCWGSNQLGQLGRGEAPATLQPPAPVIGLLSAARIVLGDQHGCALLNDSSLLCWGTNVSGTVGNGSADNATAPVQVLDGVVAVGSSGDAKHTCAAKLDGTLWCWGNNDSGQLGAPPETLIKSATPRQVAIASVKLVGAGAHHSCAVTMDGSLWCWGSNHSGQLGAGDAGNQSTPMRVPCN